MSTPRIAISVIASALAVLGCASPGPQQPTAPFVRASETVRHGAGPQANYTIGRYFQGQMRFDEAINAYRQAIAADPRHAGAHNALGVIHSQQGRADLAEQSFRAALDITPDAAEVHNNLGYHLMSNGRTLEALESFERAGALEPTNRIVALNLAAARVKLSLGADPVPAAPVLVAAPPAPPVVAPAPTATPVPAVTAQLEPLASGVWALHSAAPESRQAEPPVQAVVAPASPAATRIAGVVEIANGNGTIGLARNISRLLASGGVERARLTNNKPFGTLNSRIDYVAGAEQAARDINATLPTQLPLARVAKLERNAPVRVLLGKDFSPATTLTQLSTRSSS